MGWMIWHKNIRIDIGVCKWALLLGPKTWGCVGQLFLNFSFFYKRWIQLCIQARTNHARRSDRNITRVLYIAIHIIVTKHTTADLLYRKYDNWSRKRPYCRLIWLVSSQLDVGLYKQITDKNESISLHRKYFITQFCYLLAT